MLRPSNVVGMTPRVSAATDGANMDKAPREKTVVVRPRPTRCHVERLRRQLGKAMGKFWKIDLGFGRKRFGKFKC